MKRLWQKLDDPELPVQLLFGALALVSRAVNEFDKMMGRGRR